MFAGMFAKKQESASSMSFTSPARSAPTICVRSDVESTGSSSENSLAIAFEKAVRTSPFGKPRWYIVVNPSRKLSVIVR